MATHPSDPNEVDELLENRHELVRDRFRNHQAPLIGYMYDYVPPEVIEAAGAIPVRVAPYETDVEIQAAREYVQTSFVCGFVNATFEEILRGRYDYLDGLVTGHACTPLQRMHEQVTYYDTFEFTHYVKAPTNLDAASSIEFYTDELERLATAIADYADTTVNRDSLESAIEQRDAVLDQLSELYALRTQHPPKLSGTTALQAAFATQLLSSDAATEFLGELHATGQDREPIEGQRTFVTGCSSYKTDIVKLIERQGGVVVADDTMEGSRLLARPDSGADDPYERLARLYLGKPAGSYKADFESRLRFVEASLKRHDIEKVIMLTPKFCDPYMLRRAALKELVDETGRDFLELPFEHSIADEGQLRLRIQSFFE